MQTAKAIILLSIVVNAWGCYFNDDSGQGSAAKGAIPLPGDPNGGSESSGDSNATSGGGTSSSDASVVTISPQVAVANGNAQVTVSIFDGSTGSARAYTPLTITTSGVGNYVSGPIVTDANGNAVVNVASTQAGNVTISVAETASGASVGQVSAQFTLPQVAAGGVSLGTRHSPCTNDGKCQVDVVLSVQDTTGAPLAGASVSFTVTGSNNTLRAGKRTGLGGQALLRLASTVAESKSVSATVSLQGTVVNSPTATVSFTTANTAPAACANGSVVGGRPAIFAYPQMGYAAVADFNGDGQQDIASNNGANGNVFIALGGGNGTFSAPVAVTATGVVALAHDLTGDGKADLLVVNDSSTLTVYPGAGNGTFMAGVQSTAPTSSVSLPMSASLIESGSVAQVIYTLDGNAYAMTASGAGALQATDAQALCVGATGPATADFTGDGVLDIVVGCANGNVAVAKNNGDGTFGAPTASVIGTQSVRALVAGDFNGDGFADVVVDANGVLLFAAGQNTGAFAATITVGTTSVQGPSALGAGKATLDRNLALVVSGDGVTSFYAGHGDGTFAAPDTVVNALLQTATPSVALADFDNDQFVDVLVTSLTGGSSDALWLSPANPSKAVNASYGIAPNAFAVGDGALKDADFDGDGFNDLLLVGSLGNALLDRGDGTFVAQSAAAFAEHGASAAGDFNGNGCADLVAADGDVYVGNCDGTLTQMQGLGVTADTIRLGDFNGDGFLDVTLATFGTDQLQALLGDGSGAFTPATAATLPASTALVTPADYDGDGHLDVAALTKSGALSIMHGAGDGTFSLLSTSVTLQNDAVALPTGDVNNDGHADLVALGSFGALTVALGNGAGNFTLASSVTTLINAFSTSATLVDLNQDGNLDIVAASGALSVYFGKGNGTFAVPTVYAPAGAQAVSSSDFNGDGLPDLAYTAASPGVLLNGGCY